jgi:hypothetical protein
LTENLVRVFGFSSAARESAARTAAPAARTSRRVGMGEAPGGDVRDDTPERPRMKDEG